MLWEHFCALSHEGLKQLGHSVVELSVMFLCMFFLCFCLFVFSKFLSRGLFIVQTVKTSMPEHLFTNQQKLPSHIWRRFEMQFPIQYNKYVSAWMLQQLKAEFKFSFLSLNNLMLQQNRGDGSNRAAEQNSCGYQQSSLVRQSIPTYRQG